MADKEARRRVIRRAVELVPRSAFTRRKPVTHYRTIMAERLTEDELAEAVRDFFHNEKVTVANRALARHIAKRLSPESEGQRIIVLELSREEAMRLKDDALADHAEFYMPNIAAGVPDPNACVLCSVKDKLRQVLGV